MLQRSSLRPTLHTGGHRLQVPQSRRLVLDVLHYSRKVPGIPMVRHCQIAPVAELRPRTAPRIGWPVLFMKAFGLVAARHPVLRQTFMTWPWAHLYEHPVSVARMTVSREFRGEMWVFFAQFIAPELLPLAELQRQVDEKKHAPIESIDKFRQQYIFSKFPLPLRRLAWWSTLNLSGPKRIERMGTFGMTTVSSRGAIGVHPPSLYTTMLTFGPVAPDGHVRVTFVYDHRVLDGLEVADCLADFEETLNGPIADELREML
jgi:hypothetical protein